MIRKLLSGTGVLRAALSSALLVGCVENPDDIGSTQSQSLQTAPSDQLTLWNERFYQVLCPAGAQNIIRCARHTTMAMLAAHDAVNGVKLQYTQYGSSVADSAASPVVAAVAAMHTVASSIFPSQQATIDGWLNDTLATEPNENKRSRGLALGQAAGQAIIALRTNDGVGFPDPYFPTNPPIPGRYQFTPGLVGIAEPAWGHVKPFAMASADQFRAPGPPALTSAAYTEDWNEVYDVGRDTSTSRTADQTAYAHFWYESSPFTWNRIARTIVNANGLDLWDAARLYSYVGMAQHDGFVGGIESKRFYDHWRPYHAIRLADTDGNPDTTADPTWTMLRANPAVQEYPSTHSVLGMAGATAIAAHFGTSAVSVTFTTTTAVPANSTRSYTDIVAAAEENADSRVRAGIHFRFATDDGNAQGAQIGGTIATLLTVVEDDQQ